MDGNLPQIPLSKHNLRLLHTPLPQLTHPHRPLRPDYFSTASPATRRSPLTPVYTAIESNPAPEKMILVHLFSNGGTLSFLDICELYRKGKVTCYLPKSSCLIPVLDGRL